MEYSLVKKRSIFPSWKTIVIYLDNFLLHRPFLSFFFFCLFFLLCNLCNRLYIYFWKYNAISIVVSVPSISVFFNYEAWLYSLWVHAPFWIELRMPLPFKYRNSAWIEAKYLSRKIRSLSDHIWQLFQACETCSYLLEWGNAKLTFI